MLPAWAVASWAALNAAAFLLTAADKLAARRGRPRVSERMLLAVALLGGAAGVLAAMLALRHKTRKPAFFALVAAALALHALLVTALR